MLGEREVNGHGREDHDRIEVGGYEGKFSKLTIVVENSDLEMIDFKIELADRKEFHPKIAHFFREGQRTRAMDLPPFEQRIRYIDFNYRNIPGEGHAHVAVWGFRLNDAPPPPPPPPPPVRVEWDSRGWELLGVREVNGHGREDHDRIEVGKLEGKFTKLTIVVENADLEMVDMEVKFHRGESWHPEVRHYFKEGQRTRVVDFPGDGRTLRYVDFRYRNIPGEGHARVAVWAKRAEAPAPPAQVWESRGWVMLGEREVDGHRRVDHDRIDVGSAEGRFSKLTIVVLDADLEMIDMDIKFKHGEPWHPALARIFREGQRTHVIDFPEGRNGSDERVVEHIDFKYKNLPGEGHARVQVWAK